MNKDDTLQVAVIGCGDRGKAHAKDWGARGDARVVAVCDPLPDRREALAKETGAAPYEAWRDAVLHEGVDVVSVCTPTALHADVTCLAAEHGRHVFGEKPMALTVEQGERMLATLREQGVAYMPCFQYRDRGFYTKCREYFRDGAFGGPVVFRYTGIREVRPKTAMHSRAINGGVVIDMACHLFDLMRWITGKEPVRLYAAGHVFGEGKARLAEIHDKAVDEAAIEVTMEDGHQLHLYLNWGMPEGFPAVSDDQWLVGPELAVLPGEDGEAAVLHADHREVWPAAPNPDNRVRLERLVDAIRGRAEPDITAEDGLIALKMSHAALASIETGRALAFEA